MRFVFAEHPPRPDANLISVHASSLEAAVTKVRANLLWLSKVGDRLYETIDRTVYQVYWNEDGMGLLSSRYGVFLPPEDFDPQPTKQPSLETQLADHPIAKANEASWDNIPDNDDPAEHDGARD